MLPSGLVRAGLRIAAFLVVPSLLMLPFQPPGSAAQVITLLCVLVGVLFGGGLLAVAWLTDSLGPRRVRSDKGPAKGFNGAGRRDEVPRARPTDGSERTR